MVERKNKGFRIDCEEVQGEGSYLVLSRPRYEHIKGLRNELEGDAFENALNIVSMLFVEWNWVDDFDQPLPTPKDDPDIFSKLPLTEQNFLVNQFNQLNQVKEKN